MNLVRFVLLLSVAFEAPTVQSQTWMKTYGGVGSEGFFSVDITSDTGYIALGTTGTVFGSGGDMYLVRVDKNGDLVWSTTLGPITVDEGRCVRTVNGGFAVFGTSLSPVTSYDMKLILVDNNGSVVWDKHYGGSDWDFGQCVQPLTDGFIIAGQSFETGGGDGVIIRTDLNGDLLWEHRLGGAGADAVNSVIETNDGGFVACGSFGTSTMQSDAFVLKLDAVGAEEWSVIIPSDSNEVAMDIIQTQNGDFLICGISDEFEPFQQMLIARYSPAGTEQWRKYIGVNDDFAARSLQENDQGELYVFGDNNAFGLGGSDYYLLHTDAAGNFLDGSTYGGGDFEIGYEIAKTLDSGYIMAGSTTSFGPGPKAGYLVKTDSVGQTATLDIDSVFDPLSVDNPSMLSYDFRAYPSIVRPGDKVTVSGLASGIDQILVISPSGRVVVQKPLAGAGFIIGALAPGPYVLKCVDSGRVAYSKIMVVR
jgi:hypothetical protein